MTGARVEPLASPEDLDAVVAIEAATFHNPTGRAWYEAELARPDVCKVFVLRQAPAGVIGFVAFWRVADEMHINNLAVHPDWRGRGYGRWMLARVLDAASSMGVRQATLEVRASNGAALRLYGSAGFRQVGVRRAYYTQPVEDALVLAARLNPSGHGARVPE